MPPPYTQDDPGAEQPFISHLIELRDRLMRMLVAILVMFLVLFPFANDIYTYVAAPLMAQLPDGTSMIATQVASPFLTPFKLALVAAVFLSMPYLLYQLWSFVAPGLYQHEKRLAFPLLVSSILLFYLGMAFAYYVVFPLVFAFFTATAPEGVAVMTDISAYLDFVLTLFFAFGIAFEIPIATILLVAAGITTPDNLARKRPYVIVGVFVMGMLLTPPDVISQTLLALPMWLLFEAGILFSRYFVRGRPAEEPDDPEPQPAGGGGASPPGEGLDGHPSGGGGNPRPGSGGAVIGADLEPGDIRDPQRFRPMTDEEMEAELDAIEAAEATADPRPRQPSNLPPRETVEAKLRKVMDLREEDDQVGARRLLYEVLIDGDEEQRRVARNILAQLDLP